MNTLLAKNLHLENDFETLDLSITELVDSASQVIVPLGPISTFAARHPWERMEQQSFEQTARFFQNTCNVDIFPNHSMFKSAWKQGEISQDFLEMGIQKWLDRQSLELPREVAENYCRTALLPVEKISSKNLDIPELKSLAKRLSRFKSGIGMIENRTLQTFSQRLEQLGGAKVAKELDYHIIKWCKLFLDSEAVWSMSNRKEGFYHAWRRLVKHDPALSNAVRKQLNKIPEEADQALQEALLELKVPYKEIQDYLQAHLLALPGWAGAMLWRAQQSSEESSLLLEYLAVRISLEFILIKPYLPLPKEKVEDKGVLESLIIFWSKWGDMPIEEWSQLSSTEIKARLKLAYRFDKILRDRLLLEAWEKTYEDHLRNLITTRGTQAEETVKPILAQFAFCIDVRSEPLRRKLEQAGPFETFGTAGFFGLPIETTELGSKHSHHSLPVMFKPQFKIKETSAEFKLKQYKQRKQTVNSLSSTFKTMKHNMLSSLLLPELSGPWLSIQTLARSVTPRSAGNAFRKIGKTWLHKPSTELSIDHVHSGNTELSVGFSDEEKVYYVRQALTMMGLTEYFAPLVVICGHGSHSTNNPYASSLDCGACGGASSGFNARVLADMCNLPKVRETLAKEGISIPADTVFVAAEHITSLDELRWLYVPELSKPARTAFDCIQAELPQVSTEVNAERIAKLPAIGPVHKNPVSEAGRRAEDWSEVRPEWGLARNAAFIIGKRELTKVCNLDGRVFLHNYDWKKDRNGATLANIIAGPATVAQWINLQYYASTVAPHYYGSGSKTTQTVTSGIGVMQGNASDLLSGLPWQSVMETDKEVYHSPLRLLVVIQATKEYVERLLYQHPEFHQKIQNGWLRLASINPEGKWDRWS